MKVTRYVGVVQLRPHLEQPDLFKIDLLERRRAIKERAFNSDDKARKILYLMDKPYEDNITTRLPKYPKEPLNLAEIDVPEWLMVTLKDETFLYYDSGSLDQERFLVFCTKSNNKLMENRNIFCDGTFSVAPKYLKQIYTIHVEYEGHSLPVVYAFLTRKAQALYTHFLSKIREKLNIFPSSFTSDFQIAFIKSVQSIFPGTPVNGCYFHFKQSMWPKIQELGLSVGYCKDQKVYNSLVMPQSLVYLPEDDVLKAFEEIKELKEIKDLYAAKIQAFYEYFEEYYVAKSETSRGRYNKKIVTKSDPLFPV
ncbi:unnamed protein product [Brachionus calyciflorus]|uniref:MULE transposase domain-containing protein n=1 Tax=Brachionus calyciflorus TaxID=104777 RepID=A0A814F6Q4_9BILA|nr:unnamed protein product [Brachionus calyciflorus]